MASLKSKSLIDCKTIDDVAALECDNFERGNFNLMTDGYTVWLSQQAVGELPTQKVEIPKCYFDFLVRKYVMEQGED